MLGRMTDECSFLHNNNDHQEYLFDNQPKFFVFLLLS